MGSNRAQIERVKEAAQAAYQIGLAALFAQDSQRASRFTFDAAGLHFDFSKLHISDSLVSAGTELGEAAGFEAARQALFSGAIVNPSEGRPALHPALRADAPDADVAAAQDAFLNFARNADMAQVDDIIHLGIGGSALGPDMLLKAFIGMGLAPKLRVHVVSNIDGAALAPVLASCDPRRTRVILTSKSFTTVETLTNTEAVLEWMTRAGVENPKANVIAVTAAPDKAKAWGIADPSIVAFPEGVGGRYSLWSAVGLPVVLCFGADSFEQFLAGARDMDAHAKTAPFNENVPAIAALMDFVYANALGAQSRATFVYDERLSLLPAYLQQLETESNGKHVDVAGAPVGLITSPIVWGGTGTDAQHAVFQMLHQGSHLIPTEFIAACAPQHDMEAHHELLLANCLAQSAALMLGKTPDEARVELGDSASDALVYAKSFPGNRPSTTILMENLSPETLGALIAFYEHRVFFLATLLGINPFDQMGVELGKQMAKQLEPYIGANAQSPDASLDASTLALLEYLRST